MKNRIIRWAIAIGIAFALHPLLSAAPSVADIFVDDFDDGSIDSALWTTGGSTTYERNGVQEIRIEVTDGGGWARTAAIVFNPESPITVERDVFIHSHNNRFLGNFIVWFEDAPEFNFGVNYGNMDYWSDAHPERHGIFLFRNGYYNHVDEALPNNSPTIPAIWDQWFHEKLVYRPGAGVLDYYIDDVLVISYFVGYMPAFSNPRLSIHSQPWGWWTGHYQLMDNLQVNTGVVANESMTFGALKNLYR